MVDPKRHENSYNEKKQKTTSALPQNTTRREKPRFDFRWLIAAAVLIITLAVAITINLNHNKTDSAKIASTIDIDNGDLKINWNRYQTVDIELSDTLTISESGTYHLTGSLTDGNIIIDAGVNEVRLLLDGVTITNSTGPAIVCHAAEDLVIELVGDNTISDGTTYSIDYDEDVTGAIYSKADLVFQGNGALYLTANYADAIVGKDDVKFNNGTYHITAADDGIRGKDSVYIVNGDFGISAVADAIKSTNEIDTGKGFVLIENGGVNLTTTEGKGIKAPRDILIYDGNFIINTYDDAIHSDNYVGIIGGTFNIVAGDDALHANRELIIDGGNINIAKTYEGLEAQAISINGGDISIIATDDGINAGGGNDNSSASRVGGDIFNTDENCILSINGGNVYVNAAGDGIDSNGWLYFNGGKVIVDGPTNNGNGALDAGLGIVMNGGEAIALGSSGMAETLGSSSSVYNTSVYFPTSQTAGTTVEIKDTNDTIILSHTAEKSFSHLAAGSEQFNLGGTYAIYLNGEKYQDFTISNITTTVGNPDTNQRMMPGRR